MMAAQVLSGQQAGRQRLDADFKEARLRCDAPVSSGSVGLSEAVVTLQNIAAQDPAFPQLKSVLDRCMTAQKKQREEEDRLFQEAQSDYQRKAFEEAKRKFKTLAGAKTPYVAQANQYLYRIDRESAPATSAASEKQDFEMLDKAKKLYEAKSPQAKRLFETLVGKPHTDAEARKYLKLIEIHENNQKRFQQGMRALIYKRGQEALDIFTQIQQQEPDYPGLAAHISDAQKLVGASATAPRPADSGLDRAKNLFAQRDFTGARSLLREMQAARPESAETRDLLRKVDDAIAEEKKVEKFDRLVKEADGLLRRKDYPAAEQRLRSALHLVPDDADAQEMLKRAREGMRRTGQAPAAEDRSAALATQLENALRGFYAGNFGETTRALEQYLAENGKQKALACFYLGAVAGTEYYLGGGKDKTRAAAAHNYFARSRESNARFEPPRDWVSPKIIAMYENRTAAR